MLELGNERVLPTGDSPREMMRIEPDGTIVMAEWLVFMTVENREALLRAVEQLEVELGKQKKISYDLAMAEASLVGELNKLEAENEMLKRMRKWALKVVTFIDESVPGMDELLDALKED